MSASKPRLAVCQRVLFTMAAFSAFAALGWVLWHCRYGIDFTDEGFYLVWMSNPFRYSVSLTQFGFIYHPLYRLLDGNIAALRQANILITFFLAWVLSSVFLKTIYGRECLENAARYVISGTIATASLVFLSLWIPTPSYNSLTLQALLVTAIGLLLTDSWVSSWSIVGSVLMGLGGGLAFMAKPTTAAALALCSSVYLLAAGKFNLRLLGIMLSMALGFVTITALFIDGSIMAFINRLHGGLETLRTLRGTDSAVPALRLDLELGDRAKYILAGSTAIIFCTAYFSQSKVRAICRGAALLSIAFAIASLAIVLEVSRKTMDAGYFQALLLCAIPFAAVLVGFALYRFKGLAEIARHEWALMISFLLFPFLYTLGTSNNYWLMSGNAGIFWVLAGLVLLRPVASNRHFPAMLLSLGLAAQLVTVALVHAGIEEPYRQPHALRDDHYRLDIGKPGSTLILPDEFGKYVTDAVQSSQEAGFKEGTPMIDLTGQSPGVLYALGAHSIGTPWIIGGYSGSDGCAIEALKMGSCEELATAWLLTEPEGPLRISAEILSSIGATLATDFVPVGTLRTAEGAGGYKEVRIQQLLKPVRSPDIAMMACKAARTTNP